MPKLTSTTGGRDVFVPDDQPDQWRQMVATGGYKVADGESASYVDAYGHQTVADTGVINQDQARGVQGKIEDQGTVVNRAREERLKDQTSTAGSLIRGGLSMGTFGLSDDAFDPETIEADQLHHGTARAIGQIGVGLGSIFLDPVAMLGIGADAGRAGMAARELAMSTDALQAEHVGSAISSRALLGGEATTTAERSLMRASDALGESKAARGAISSVPEDLAGLDAAGLKEAAKTERASLKAQAEAERASLEELRGPQRAELANDIRDMHVEMTSERPIFQAVVGDDVRAIPGVKDIASQLNKSYRGLRSTLDNPIAVAENPGMVLKHLQMRQTALESLQLKAPEIQAVLGSDARAGALVHVDDALVQTKEQIARIGQLNSRANPVAGARLSQLEAGISPRLNAIEAAQEALAKAPEIGMLQKGAQAATFAGATALAHMIPGVGIAAPFAGKWAAETVGKLFGKLAGAGAAIGERSSAALDSFLNVASKAVRNAPITATQVLGASRFSAPKGDETTGLSGLFKARSAEIRSQTMYDQAGNVVIRPDARKAIAAKLAPVAAVNPLLADKLETLAVRKVEFISGKIPRQPDVGGLQIGPDNWKPSELAMRSWARTIRAVEDPGSVEDRLAAGVITPEESEAYRSVYPERFAAMQSAIYQAAPKLAKTLPMRKKVALSIFTGVPLIPALQPNVLQVLQGNFQTEKGSEGGTQAPKPLPAFGALGSMKSLDKPTAAQQRGG